MGTSRVVLNRSTVIFFSCKIDLTDRKEDGTLDDQRRDGGTNSTLRIKEQGMHLTLNEHDDDKTDLQ